MKKTNRLFLVLILLSVLGCKNSEVKETPKTKKSVKSELKLSSKVKKTLNQTQKEIVNVALSFHKWYIKNTNNIESKVPTDFIVTEGKNDNCIVDYKPYFEELRKLGTVSESFMEKEKQRTKLCTETISKMKWSEYIGVIPENCDDYLFWTRSQEDTSGIDFIDIEEDDGVWRVNYRLFNKFNNTKEYLPHKGIISVEKQKNGFMITEINWI